MNIFEPYTIGGLTLKNRLVMSPMTRSRAIDNLPNALMAKYYGQRASAGLIITEGVAPSANGLGYARIPGAFTPEQMEGWKLVTDAVHSNEGKIFMQIMHTGRVSHSGNMHPDARIVAPSAIAAPGEMYTDVAGMQAYETPSEMTDADIKQAIGEFVTAAKNAVEAGFDGVEIHGANGYLVDQFINPASNHRSDQYGGSIENRSRFAIEVATQVAEAIGSDKTSMRLSPYGVNGGMEKFDGLEDAYTYLAGELGKLNLAYLHIADMSSMGAPTVTESVKEKIKTAFSGTIIRSGGLDKQQANSILQKNKGDLFAFGRPFLANPDLVYRLENDLPLTEGKHESFFTPGEEGYTDYLAYSSTAQV